MRLRGCLVAGLFVSLTACAGGAGVRNGGGGGIPPVTGPTNTPLPASTPAVAQGPGTPLSGSATYSGNAWSPYGVASGLDFPVQHGWDGTGQSVAVIIDSNVDNSALGEYGFTFGVPLAGRITTVSVDGASGIASNGDASEADLDVETIASLAPGSHIYIYQTPDLTDRSLTDAYSKLNSDGLVRVASASFSGCEAPNLPEDRFIAQGAAAGITYVASSGDSGNVCDGVSRVGATWPASNPNVVAVGGTETSLSAHDAITNGRVWNDCTPSTIQSSPMCAAGGGVSSVYSLPSYQSGLAGISSRSKRNEPDVSMPAVDFIEYTNYWAIGSGTSWSAPQYAALMAEVLQYCHADAGISNAASLPYFVHSHYPAAYIDVTGGNDQFSGTPYYAATAGYDNASGLGVPYGTAYANTACPGGTQALGVTRLPALSPAQTPPASAPLDVTPRVSGLLDRGRRSQIAMTRVQLVLNSEGDRSAVESALEQAGFTIDRRYEYRQIVHAQAPAATLERFFGTQLHDVEQVRYGTRYMPVTQVIVPPSIASRVYTVNLDNLVTRHVLSDGAPAWPLDALMH